MPCIAMGQRHCSLRPLQRWSPVGVDDGRLAGCSVARSGAHDMQRLSDEPAARTARRTLQALVPPRRWGRVAALRLMPHACRLSGAAPGLGCTRVAMGRPPLDDITRSIIAPVRVVHGHSGVRRACCGAGRSALGGISLSGCRALAYRRLAARTACATCAAPALDLARQVHRGARRFEASGADRCSVRSRCCRRSASVRQRAPACALRASPCAAGLCTQLSFLFCSCRQSGVSERGALPARMRGLEARPGLVTFSRCMEAASSAKSSVEIKHRNNVTKCAPQGAHTTAQKHPAHLPPHHDLDAPHEIVSTHGDCRRADGMPWSCARPIGDVCASGGRAGGCPRAGGRWSAWLVGVTMNQCANSCHQLVRGTPTSWSSCSAAASRV